MTTPLQQAALRDNDVLHVVAESRFWGDDSEDDYVLITSVCERDITLKHGTSDIGEATCNDCIVTLEVAEIFDGVFSHMGVPRMSLSIVS